MNKVVRGSMVGAVALALMASACGGDDSSSSGSSAATVARTGKLVVVTTVAPITSIVANIAGDRATVTGIVPEGTNSHTFEPKPSVAEALSKADVIFINGLQLEEPTKKLAEANKRESTEIVELGNMTITPDQYIYDFSFPKDEGKPNPHLWTNPPMAKKYAQIASDTLADVDPANAAYYRANYSALAAKIDALDAAMRRDFATVTPEHRKLLTYHDAYAYFAKEYGWSVIGAIQVSDFEDPTPKEVGELIDQVKAAGVPAIFGSEVFPSPVLEQIGKEANVKYVDELRDDDLPGAPGENGHSWLGLMRFDYQTMTEALGGTATALRALDVSDVVADSANYPQ
ncbi:MAG: metal ABC transporter substrate-binding protein [Acidimicrobiia bacterium]